MNEVKTQVGQFDRIKINNAADGTLDITLWLGDLRVGKVSPDLKAQLTPVDGIRLSGFEGVMQHEPRAAGPHPIRVKFRDTNPEVVRPVREAFPEWDVKCSDIFYGNSAADIIVSPANCTGRMDGGIDQIYINRFGWQLEKRLMRDILNVHGGRLPIGEARLITTYDQGIPLMICAPTMEWPPGNVSHTDNAYLAFKATLECAKQAAEQVFGGGVTLLVPGLATATGCMPGYRCAEQMRRAWDEHHSIGNPHRVGLE